MAEKFIRDALVLWATIDPIGTLSIFSAMTQDQAPAQRRRTAFKAILYSAVILVVAAAAGQFLLDGLGIDLLSLQVAGGAILFLFALQMIFGTLATESSATGEADHDVAVFPIAVPSIASPGAIMAIIVLTDNERHSVVAQVGTTAILLAILAVTWALMLLSTPILRVIGKNGASLLIRIMGLILAALSVQLVIEALETKFGAVLKG